LYTVLDAKQLDEIHLATLNVLERAGVMVHEDSVLQLLKSAGCEVDQKRNVAKFPEKVIHDTIKKTPHNLVLGGRDKEHDLLIERGKTFTRPGSAYTKVLDIDTGQCRNGTLKDTEIAAKLVDALENISFCATHISPSDVPQSVADICAVKVCLETTRKHLFFSPLTHETFRTIIEAAQVVRGGKDEFQKRPLVSFLAATYGARCAPIDMRTGFLSWGSAETALMSAAAVQIAHYYNMPVDGHGPCTDSKTFDEQVGFEKSMTGLLPAMAGAEIISAAGIVDSLVVTSPLQLVVDDEFFGIMFRILNGIKVDHETLATELISQVGYDASYLKFPHTLRNYEKEHYLAQVFDKRFRGPWEAAGAESVDSVAKKRVQSILSKHEITPLDRDIQKKLDEIVRRE
jgi:trimethylamine:corrinoid methyltransferase-like protein